MSLHTWKSFEKARGMGAQAAASEKRWAYLADMSKRELAELVTHLAAMAADCDSVEAALADDDILIDRIAIEYNALKLRGMI